MNRRLLFLSGHLSGLLAGAALVWIYCSNTSLSNAAGQSTQPNAVVLPVSYPNYPHVPPDRELPDGSKPRYFNGQPYYIIPVEDDASSKI